ncbi:MAG: glycosyltransferase family 1 protein [Planctomycetota bacterium]|nr:MAG: glycosyltransferase family 1 protein [Planctomycetota bacterium]
MRLLYLVTEDLYFWSHRLPLARAARDAGYEVLVATAPGDLRARIESEGFRYFPLQLRRGPRNPWQHLAAVRELTRLYRYERPDIVHHVSMLPVLAGSIAARRAGITRVVNTVTGLGHVFLAQGAAAALRRALVQRAYRHALAHTRVVFQNRDDLELFTQRRLVRPGQCVIIPGSGVDTDRFVPTPEPEGDPMILYTGRMLWTKGLRELAAAARILKRRGLRFQVVLAGRRDEANPACLSEHEIRAWEGEGLLQWAGHVDDIAPLLRASAIVCLPSYREGLPLSLLEGAASARPLVATDVPGCRDVVRDGVNGGLVPACAPDSLAAALRVLLEDRDLRRTMGKAGRRLVLQRFALQHVIPATLALYQQHGG